MAQGKGKSTITGTAAGDRLLNKKIAGVDPELKMERKGRKYAEKVVGEVTGPGPPEAQQYREFPDDYREKAPKEGISLTEVIRKSIPDIDIAGIQAFVTDDVPLIPASRASIEKMKEGFCEVYPAFTGKKFIGGIEYEFKKGKGIIVPEDVRRILREAKKLLIA